MERMIDRKPITEFINLYRERPCLWDFTLPSYKLQPRRLKALHELAEILKRYYPDAEVNIQHVRKKIDTLRNGYFRERKRIMQSIEEKESDKDIRLPCLWYYDLMSFLQERSKSSDPSRSERMVDVKLFLNSDREEQGNFQKNNPMNDQPIDKYLAGVKKRKLLKQLQKHRVHQTNILVNKATNKSRTEETYTNINKNITKPEEDDENEFDVFGKHVGLQLKTLQFPQQTIAQKLISDIIYYAKMGKLSPECTIDVESGNQSTLQYISTSPEYLEQDSSEEEKYVPGQDKPDDDESD